MKNSSKLYYNIYEEENNNIPEEVKMKSIGLILNDHQTNYIYHKDLTRDCYLMFLPKIKFQSIESIKENVGKLTEMIIEFLQEEKSRSQTEDSKKEIRVLPIKLKRFIRYFNLVKNRDKLIMKVWELILSLDGMGTLAGFGFGNKFGDRLQGNAEKESLFKGRTLLRE